MKNQSTKNYCSEIFNAALKAVSPYEAVKLHTDKIRSMYRDGRFNRLLIIGFGKASCPMAKAVEDDFIDIIHAGAVVTKYGHTNNAPQKILVFEGGHPVPDENGVKGTRHIMQLLNDTDKNTLLVCLISGGGSALLVSPYEGLSLEEKQKTTQLLLASGATIHELNTVRKHISAVKGGRLAEHAYPARIISLILSDVIGDDLDVIASGPTAPDNSTYQDAMAVLEKYRIDDKIPPAVLQVIHKGISGIIPETPKEKEEFFISVDNMIIGSNRIALQAAKARAESLGFETHIISDAVSGEARDVARWLAQKAIETKIQASQKNPVCLISGGETTVTVKGNGLGGRNMEFALSFALEIEDTDGITLISAGTDGTDGPTDAAGAIVDGNTISEARTAGLDPAVYLENNDSYHFFKKTGGLLITGPTGTNVMDLQIVLIDGKAG